MKKTILILGIAALFIQSCSNKKTEITGNWSAIIGDGSYMEFYFHGDTVEPYEATFKLWKGLSFKQTDDSLFMNNVGYKIISGDDELVLLYSEKDTMKMSPIMGDENTLEKLIKDGVSDESLDIEKRFELLNTYHNEHFLVREKEFLKANK
jgi:hypothetical protein